MIKLEKACSICKATKPIDDFNRLAKSRDGRDPRCRACKTDRVRGVRQTDSWRSARRARPKTRAELDSAARRMSQWKARNPEKVRAHQAVKAAKKSGAITVHPCACGSTKALQAHHHRGYADGHRLDVIWLCRPCHVREHHG